MPAIELSLRRTPSGLTQAVHLRNVSTCREFSSKQTCEIRPGRDHSVMSTFYSSYSYIHCERGDYREIDYRRLSLDSGLMFTQNQWPLVNNCETQSTLSLRPLSQATSSSYDHLCKTPFKMSLIVLNKRLS